MLPGAAGSTNSATRAVRAPMSVPSDTAGVREDNQQDFTCGICFDDIVQSGKHFGLLSNCPFGPRCFYAHRDAEGHDVKHLDRPKRSMKPRRGRNGRQENDAALQSLLQQYSHLFRFFEVADWDDFDLVGGLYDSEDSDEYGLSDNEYDSD
ncbi:unnamed protein product [Phytophthora fragariaefolia]|uniref:Unnamed protein product n=1 Tax=Phytophthora fragariaefolia TaxID=1490495 RepID=A0A9W6YGQ2_9STRA|nr:unnamed protein product [Phytophthora fragariaefolia]